MPKVPEAISQKQLTWGSATISIDFRAQQNPLDKLSAESKVVGCEALVDPSRNAPDASLHMFSCKLSPEVALFVFVFLAKSSHSRSASLV